MNWMLQTVKEGIMAVLLVAGPIVFVASAIGLAISLVQTVTNIQDQTTPAALKIVAISVVLIVGGTWMFEQLKEFTINTIDKSFSMVSNNRTAIDIPKENDAKLVQTFSNPFQTGENLQSDSKGKSLLNNFASMPNATFNRAMESLPPQQKMAMQQPAYQSQPSAYQPQPAYQQPYYQTQPQRTAAIPRYIPPTTSSISSYTPSYSYDNTGAYKPNSIKLNESKKIEPVLPKGLESELDIDDSDAEKLPSLNTESKDNSGNANWW